MKLLITDLDNTLYDWVTFFARSFSAMTQKLVEMTSLDREQLLNEFRDVHRRYGSSEHPFSVLELPSIQHYFGTKDRTVLYNALRPALDAFSEARREHLRLYPSVEATLRELITRGVRVIGHTEAIGVNAYSRLRRLSIDGCFSHLYALEANLKPHPAQPSSPRADPPPGFMQVVPLAERKPNPRLLADICGREGVDLQSVWYVGDSLTRDMSMARAAGVHSVWARYGTTYDRGMWDTLVRVTHWTDQDVRRESELRAMYSSIQPDHVIDRFSDLMSLIV